MQSVLDQSELIWDRAAIDAAIDRLAVRVTLALADRDPVAVCVMTGGVFFAGELLKRLRFPLRLDYMHATRYDGGTSGGRIEWRALPSADLAGSVVLVLDDVLDRGETLAAVVAKLSGLGAAEVRTAVLVDKRIGRSRPIEADFAALEGPDRYLFGGGMDFRGYWRNLPEIYAVGEHLIVE